MEFYRRRSEALIILIVFGAWLAAGLTLAFADSALVAQAQSSQSDCLPEAFGGCDTPSQHPGFDCPGGALYGCFASAEDMGRYLDTVKPVLADFFVNAYGRGFPLPDIIYVRPEDAALSRCQDGSGGQARFDEMAFFYCPPEARIYVGRELMWQFYTQGGAIAPALGIAHEWAHHLQNLRGVKADQSYKFEVQADCVAGAWWRHLYRHDLWSNTDSNAGTEGALVMMIGDEYLGGGGSDPHGSSEERIVAIAKGQTQGIRACDQITPSTPISPP